MTNDKKYLNELKDLVKTAKEMYSSGKYKNPEYGELCMTVVRLIEGSEFGKKKAESTLELKVNDPFAEMVDGSFDGTTIQLLNMSNDLLGRFGEVSMNPYCNGIHTKSARVTFEPKEEKK
ncbi:MAG: hypothetical protein KKE23_02265 [Nanoarchaeota archaeon]|nr:hypothetical protein [Nanoarchaeota archaeon]